jgi:phage head maturation protease
MRPQLHALLKSETYSKDKHTIEWDMSDESRDRDGEGIKADGWVVDGEPNVLWGHDASKPENVLGKVVGTRVDGGKFVGMIRFSQANPAARMVEAMVAEGTIDKGSVGFDPLAWEDADGTKGTREPGGPYPFPKNGRTYTKQALLEFSPVGVPSNANALARMAKAYGIEVEDEPPAVKEIEGGDDQMQELLEKIDRQGDVLNQVFGLLATGSDDEEATEIAIVAAEDVWSLPTVTSEGECDGGSEDGARSPQATA